MRNFRFRLDPVIRIKQYEIERTERKIAKLDQEIQQRWDEIEDGRRKVQDMRLRLIESVEDKDLVTQERSFDLFRHYTAQVESQKKKEIQALEEKKSQIRQELIKLYQDEKILERLKEKRKSEWNKETERKENYQMDEIGVQKFVRKDSEFGGVLLYLIVPTLLIGGALAAGLMTGVVDREMLSKIPYIGDRIGSATETVEVVSATEEDDTFTIEYILGANTDTTMKEVLQNIAQKEEQFREKERELQEKEKQLAQWESTLQNLDAKISSDVAFASQQITQLQDLQKMRDEAEKSEISERELRISDVIKKVEAKNLAPFISGMYNQSPATIDATGKRILSDDQKMVLRVLHSLPDKSYTDMITAMSKDPAMLQTGIQIAADFINTSKDELYGIEQVEPADAESETAQAIDPGMDNQGLPPPSEVKIPE